MIESTLRADQSRRPTFGLGARGIEPQPHPTPIAADGSELPNHSYDQLRYPDHDMRHEEERFSREWDNYIARGGVLDANEAQLAYIVARAFWWLRTLDQVRRQREIGGERAGAHQVNEFDQEARRRR